MSENLLSQIKVLRYEDTDAFLHLADVVTSWAQAERAYLRFIENAKRLAELNKNMPAVTDAELQEMIDAAYDD